MFDDLYLKTCKDDLGCQCAQSNTCHTVDKPTLCNCDSRGYNVTDVGILSSDQLPIYGFQFGGSLTPFSSIKFDMGPFVCSGKNGFYSSQAEGIEKEKLNSRLEKLTNDILQTEENLDELSDRTREIGKQNLDLRLNHLSNSLNETQKHFNQMKNAVKVDKQNLSLKLNQLKNQIDETNESLTKLSSRTQVVEQQNLNSRLKQLTNALKITLITLNKLSDQAEEVKKQSLTKILDRNQEAKLQNLNDRLNELTKEIDKTNEHLKQLANQADDMKQQNLALKINELKNEIPETKEQINEIFNQLDNLLGVPTKINGPITIAKNNFVTKLDYSDNFDISFEFKASSIRRGCCSIILQGKLIIYAFNYTINTVLNIETGWSVI